MPVRYKINRFKLIDFLDLCFCTNKMSLSHNNKLLYIMNYIKKHNYMYFILFYCFTTIKIIYFVVAKKRECVGGRRAYIWVKCFQILLNCSIIESNKIMTKLSKGKSKELYSLLFHISHLYTMISCTFRICFVCKQSAVLFNKTCACSSLFSTGKSRISCLRSTAGTFC